MKDRVLHDRVDLSYGDVKKFFDERGENDALKNKYNYVVSGSRTGISHSP